MSRPDTPAVKNVIFAGGGTGGHLYPAIAIAERLQEQDHAVRIHFVGTKRGLESRIIPDLGYPLHLVSIRGFSRKNPLANIWVLCLLVFSLLQCLMLVLKLRPAAVIGTGGYVSGPLLFIAALTGRPTLVQEQNSYPGVTTRLLAHFVDQVHLSFKESTGFFKKQKNIRITGNPVRKFDMSNNRENARVFFNLTPERTTVLIFGGSQGAVAINRTMMACMPTLCKETDAQFIWITGKNSYDEVINEAPKYNGRLHVTEYINNMNMAYQASNLAVCRAGAITISELAVCGLPAVLVPYPYAAADHQAYNARAHAESGAAQVITETEIENDKQALCRSIIALINDPDKRKNMSENASQAAFPNAVDTLAGSVMDLMKNKTGYRYGFIIPRQKNIIF